jgi:hypothetical protein
MWTFCYFRTSGQFSTPAMAAPSSLRQPVKHVVGNGPAYLEPSCVASLNKNLSRSSVIEGERTHTAGLDDELDSEATPATVYDFLWRSRGGGRGHPTAVLP